MPCRYAIGPRPGGRAIWMIGRDADGAALLHAITTCSTRNVLQPSSPVIRLPLTGGPKCSVIYVLCGEYSVSYVLQVRSCTYPTRAQYFHFKRAKRYFSRR